MPALSVDAATIRDRFNVDWACDPDNGVDQDTWWWYAISVRVNPNEIIADDGEGHLWSVPFTTDTDDNVTFGTPVEVRETFVPVNVGEGAAATAAVTRRRQQTLQAGFGRPEKGDAGDRTPPSQYKPAATERQTQQEVQSMTLDMEALRTRLGLGEDATEEQINEAIRGETPETFTEEQVAETVEAAVAAAREDERGKASASTADKVTLDRGAYEKIQADAAAGREARESQLKSERDAAVASAVQDGRIPPARRDHWRKLMDADPDGTASTLASLEKGLIPLAERGAASNGPDPDNPMSGEIPSTGWFPQLATTKEG